MSKVYNPFTYALPTLDLHGVDRMYASYKTKEFVLENRKLGNRKIIIIHGIGTGVVKESVHEALKNNENILEYYLDSMNLGETIVELKQ